MASIYQINKGVNKPIEFKGLKAQYIAWLAAGLVLLLIAFAILYISGLNISIILPLLFGTGTALIIILTKLSHKYGEHGLMKYFAKHRLPHYLRFKSRRLFTQLKKG
ncbi:DUF4133 domain-containing protein [Daejeonella oryzae]|uniref:DUF4133 domain-containing protein n=1 Tax=Daejeonella oryzae TaxID=1122943 RepID=UPI000420ADC2|nr:DUF4133 domain-containing protein [Daejeonella oryzae]